MINATNVVIALLVSLWFLRRARAAGKAPAHWALIGAAVYFVPASLLVGLLLGLWCQSFWESLIPLEVHFFTTGHVFYQLFAVLLPSALVGLVAALHVYCTHLAGETAKRMNARTYVFEGAALLLLAVAWLSRPGLFGAGGSQEYVGKAVFPGLTDPTAAASLEVVSPAFETFQVSRDAQGNWVIPSHQNYPAEAADRVGQAASSLIRLKILSVASQSPEQHALYGVLEPTETSKGAAGVGTRVTILDQNKTPYSLVIGKELEKSPGQRYVRVVNQDAVFVVDIPAETFSTKFEDWVQKNLLDINTSAIRSITMADYSFDVKLRQVRSGNEVLEIPEPHVERRGRFSVEPNRSAKPEEPRWKIAENKVEVKDDKKISWTDVAVQADEEPNGAKLDDMESAFSRLEIVNVQRKHEDLAEYLHKLGKFPESPRAGAMVAKYGFYLVGVDRDDVPYLSTLFPVKEGRPVLLSTQGDVRIAMEDGVVYVLRFGQIASTAKASPEKKKEPAKKEPEKKEPGKKEPSKPGEKKDGETPTPEGPTVNRYLFIMAEFDPDVLPKLQLEKLPELPKPGEPAKTEPGKTEPGKKPETPKPEAAKKAEPPKKLDPEAEKKRLEEERKFIEAERKRIEESNKEKQKDRDKRIEEGKKKVKDLNDRFADWFYVISDSVYTKIHLSRTDIVKKKEKKEETEKPGVVPPIVPPGAPAGVKEPPKEPPAPKKAEPPAAKKQVPPVPKTEPAPAAKKEPPAAKKDAPAPPPKPLEPAPAKK